MGSLAVSGGAEPGGASKEGGGVNGRDLLPPACPSGHLNSPKASASTARPLLAPFLVPAKGEQNRGAEAGANSLPWLHRRQGGGSELWEQTAHGSVGPGHVGMAQCMLSPCLVILSVSEGRVSGILQGTAHPRRGHPHPRSLPNP